ncbi:cytochrome c [Chryseobacterium soldanellicola]|uniref:Cytochrome c n=1 Tax=Chryseobacterium soldanellicola TaxID=311333 RepID=A0A1H0XTL4_9FLAO|nr:c-type cytochrome [Chryseobacterium soldanellicola]SDQ05976.1 cytochrome c [Chryseobacterium soldanellicola]
MKKLFLTGLIGLFIVSCSKKEDPSVVSSHSDVSKPAASNLTGQQIIETLDCTGCHATNERMIGPSYQEIAGKYSEKDVELLASKIIEGGSGVWGNVPMSPHPQVSKEDAKKMVEYILSQKK